MKRKTFCRVLCALICGAAVTTACVDNNYDLKNLDLTMQTGFNGLTLPSSSTGQIKLGNLFDLNDGAVEEIDSAYYLNTEGNTDPSHIKIDVITINKPKDLGFEAKLSWALDNHVRQQVRHRAGSEEPEIPDASIFAYNIEEVTNTKITNAHTTTEISHDLKSIHSVGLEPTTIGINVRVIGEEGKEDNVSIFKQIHLNDLILHLPVGLHVTSCQFKEKEILAGNAEALQKAQAEGIINISKLSDNTDYSPNSNKPLTLSVTFDKANVTTVETNDVAKNGAYFNSKEHSAQLVGEIYLEGLVYGKVSDVNTTEVTQIVTKKIEDGEIDATFLTKPLGQQIAFLMPRLIFKGSGGFNSNIAVKSFSGSVQHEIGDIKPIELNNLPDFLVDKEDTPEGEGVSLDLDNPQIYLKLTTTSHNTNGFHQRLKTGVKLEAYQNGKTKPTGEVNTGEISFDLAVSPNASSTMLKRICTSKDKEVILPNEYKQFDKDREDIYIPGLPGLLRKVPNRVKVTGHATPDIHVEVDCEEVSLPQDLNIDFEYKVFTPLSFGQDFKIVYTGTEDGLAEDLKDIDKLDFGGLDIQANVVSHLPLPITLSLIPLDMDGNDINAGGKKLTVLDDDNTITVGANQTTPISISLRPVNGYQMRDFINGKNKHGQPVPKLNGFKYKAVLNGDASSKGEVLKTSHYLILKDISISLTGGITYYDKD